MDPSLPAFRHQCIAILRHHLKRLELYVVLLGFLSCACCAQTRSCSGAVAVVAGTVVFFFSALGCGGYVLLGLGAKALIDYIEGYLLCFALLSCIYLYRKKFHVRFQRE